MNQDLIPLNTSRLRCKQTDRGYIYTFWCVGCNSTHSYECRTDNGQPTWEFNGDVENPSFSPSLHYQGKCHLFLKDGVIEYLSDCRHRYAGRKIQLPEW